MKPDKWLDELLTHARELGELKHELLSDSDFIAECFLRRYTPREAAEAIHLRRKTRELVLKKKAESVVQESTPITLSKEDVTITINSPRFRRPMVMQVREDKIFKLCDELRSKDVKDFKIHVDREETK